MRHVGACLLHKLLADADEVPEVLPIVDDAIQPVRFQGLCHGTKRWLHLPQGLFKVFHAHLHEHTDCKTAQGSHVYCAHEKVIGGAGAFSDKQVVLSGSAWSQ